MRMTNLEVVQAEDLGQRRAQREPLLAGELFVGDFDFDLLHSV